MNKLSILASSALLCTSFFITETAAAARWYPYAGVSLGQTTYDDVCGGTSGVPATACEDTDISYKIYAGTKIDRNLAIELAYVDLGEAEISTGPDTGKITASGYAASIFGIYPATQRLDIYAKAGVMYWDAERTFGATPGASTATSNGLDGLYGIGINLGINRKLAIRAEYENILRVGGEVTSGESSVTQISLGISWYF